MNVVIDLGVNNTLLTAWREDQSLDSPSISVRLAGLADFCSGIESDPWSRDILQRYITFIYQEYLLPSRLVISSVAAAIPGTPGLAPRRALLEAIEAVLGLEEALIVPRFLAMAAGWQSDRGQSSGNLMVINSWAEEVEVAFLSASPEATLTLEAICGGEPRIIREQAARLGFLGTAGWSLDHLYLLGGVDSGTKLGHWLSSLPQRIPVHSDEDPALAVAAGLFAQISADRNGERLSLLYPYDYYLNQCDQEGRPFSTQVLPFDTANLELDCNSHYRLASLDMADLAVGAADPEWVNLQIFEIEHGAEPTLPVSSWGLPVLKIECARIDLPQRLDLILDMGAAVIRPQLPCTFTETEGAVPQSFWQHYTQRLAQLFPPDPLETDPDPDHFAAQHRESSTTLDGQIALTLTRLQFLLEQWQRN